MNRQAVPEPQLFAGPEAALGALDRLPRGLWLGGLVNSQGALPARLDALEQWRDALLAGCDAPATEVDWPPAPLATELSASLGELGLPGFCHGQDELTELVLRSLLWHLDLIVDYIDRGDPAAAAATRALQSFAADWQERCGAMDELTEVFGDIADLVKNMRWDMLRGILRSQGWGEVVRIRRLLERLPELSRIIRQLGRARPTDESDESLRRDVQVMEQAMAPRALTRSIRVPDLPGETRGIVRSGRIARMLPAEAMLLPHPRLRLVWHARHAERTLLSYEDDDRMQEVLHEEVPVWRPSRQPQQDRRLEMGPMLVCVDTSGSMQGGAEAVAKATVLEAVRTAHAQKRACHVFAFGGPDEVVAMAIGADVDGVERLTAFLGQTFGGGTDIGGPLDAALAKLADARWRLADLLIASDGEFGATPETVRRLAAAKSELGLRVQGILIGDRETIGLLELADDIFWIRDWRHYGSSDADSPVHSSRLTAMYFPGALRSPQNFAATVDGATAAAAVRAGRLPAAAGDGVDDRHDADDRRH